jgi:hypothetical protein
MSVWNIAKDFAINDAIRDAYDVDWDEESASWCVFLGDKAIASFSDRAEAQEHLDRLLG